MDTTTLRQLISNWLAAVLDSLRTGQQTRTRPTATRPRQAKPKYTHVLVEGWNTAVDVHLAMTARRAKDINKSMTGGRWIMVAF